MLKPFRTLRFRLTLLYVLVFGVLQTGLWVLVDGIRSAQLHRRFDESLIQRGQSLIDTLGLVGRSHGWPPEQRTLESRLLPLESNDVYFQICRPDGSLLVNSRNLHGARLPSAEPAHAENNTSARLETLNGKSAQSFTGVHHRARVATMHYMPSAGHSWTVQTASSLETLDRMIGDVRRLLLVFAVVSLGVAGVTSWYMAGRSLAPLPAIARQARFLSASHLDRRIPVPPTGDEVAEMATVLNELLDRLEREFRSQARFIADVSHELRTPLAVLLGEAQGQLRSKHLTAEHAAFVQTVQEETRRLLRLAEAFMILTRVRAGSRPAINVDVSLEDIVLRVIATNHAEAGRRNIRLVARFDSGNTGREPLVRGDGDLLYAMVDNVVGNAVRHSPDRETVDVCVNALPREVTLAVRDRGPGIPPEELDRVFDLFYQIHASGPRAGKSGLGLSIARGVAELHGGVLVARNCLDGGCQFLAHLPRASEDGLDQPEKTEN